MALLSPSPRLTIMFAPTHQEPCFFERAEHWLGHLLHPSSPGRVISEAKRDEINLITAASRYCKVSLLDRVLENPRVQRRVHAAMLLQPELYNALEKLSNRI